MNIIAQIIMIFYLILSFKLQISHFKQNIVKPLLGGEVTFNIYPIISIFTGITTIIRTTGITVDTSGYGHIFFVWYVNLSPIQYNFISISLLSL